MDAKTPMTKEQFEQVLKLTPPYSPQALDERFREEEAWLANRIAEAQKYGEHEEQAMYSDQLEKLLEAFKSHAPADALPDKWIVGEWGIWGDWVDDRRIRTRPVTAQGDPPEKDRPDSEQVQVRVPSVPLPEKIKATVVLSVQRTPAQWLIVLLAWLLTLHVWVIANYSGASQSQSEAVELSDESTSEAERQAAAATEPAESAAAMAVDSAFSE